MPESGSFENLMARLRAGDQEAAAELIHKYEPEIRREVRVRMTDVGMRRILDSIDICQSVWSNFFARVVLGQFDLENPQQLVSLLVAMVRNKVTDWARKQRTEKRDKRRERTLEWARQNNLEPVAAEPPPSQVVSGAELLREFRSRLTTQERLISERRVAGEDWNDISAELGASPEALRKRLQRAFDRVANELRVD